MSKETLNPLANAQAQVKKACDALGADPAVYELLKEPQRMIEISSVSWSSCHAAGYAVCISTSVKK